VKPKQEYKEYFVPLPLFVAIGFFKKPGFLTCCYSAEKKELPVTACRTRLYPILGGLFLSAILDNNIVADFASKPSMD